MHSMHLLLSLYTQAQRLRQAVSSWSPRVCLSKRRLLTKVSPDAIASWCERYQSPAASHGLTRVSLCLLCADEPAAEPAAEVPMADEGDEDEGTWCLG